ncbi:DUF2993 domain-containing protein [Streptomyces sp. MS06]|uniref:LmeA family phospholipid-binding protein n=1 Tax=Streptomyces sp. MS06 TaxID=3385974 RepID=UPI00399F3E95
MTWAVVAAVVAVLAAGTGELAARHLIRERIAGKAPGLGDVSVAESGSSALWDLLHRHIPEVEVSSGDAALGPLTGVGVSARLHDVALDATPTVASTDATVTVPEAAIADAVRAKAPSVTVDSVTADPAAGTLTAAVGAGGLGRLTLEPLLSDGRVTFTATSLTVLGRELPVDSLGQGASGAGTGDGEFRPYPLGLRATSLAVTQDGVRITLHGGPSKLTAR